VKIGRENDLVGQQNPSASMLVSHDSAVAQGKDIAAKVLEKLISPLQSVYESCPNFVILQLECKDADLGDEHLRFCDFAPLQALQMRRQKRQKKIAAVPKGGSSSVHANV
jgi:hypothetical protein